MCKPPHPNAGSRLRNWQSSCLEVGAARPHCWHCQLAPGAASHWQACPQVAAAAPKKVAAQEPAPQASRKLVNNPTTAGSALEPPTTCSGALQHYLQHRQRAAVHWAAHTLGVSMSVRMPISLMMSILARCKDHCRTPARHQHVLKHRRTCCRTRGTQLTLYVGRALFSESRRCTQARCPGSCRGKSHLSHVNPAQQRTCRHAPPEQCQQLSVTQAGVNTPLAILVNSLSERRCPRKLGLRQVQFPQENVKFARAAYASHVQAGRKQYARATPVLRTCSRTRASQFAGWLGTPSAQGCALKL